MKTKFMVAGTANLKLASFSSTYTPLAAAAVLLLASAAVNAADPGGAKPPGKNAAVVLEAISGSTVKRVILSAKAAERLGIETGKVDEQPIVRKQMVSGLITGPAAMPLPGDKPAGGTFGGFGQAGASFSAPAAPSTKPVDKSAHLAKVAAVVAAPQLVPTTARVGDAPNGAAPSAAAVAGQVSPPMVGEAWVLVTVSPGEWERLAKDKPARLLALSTRDKLGGEVLAQPSGREPVEDAKRSMLTLYYMVPGKDRGLTLNSRMRVELQMAGSEDKQKVVPYSAVYYDGKGAAWVYVNTQPLTYERRRIDVERVVNDLAVLSDGPPVGISVVTVGASLLYGAEIFGK